MATAEQTSFKRRVWFPFVKGVVSGLAHAILKLKIEGTERLPLDGPIAMIGNHVNFMDPIFPYLACPRYVKGMTAVETYSRFLFSFLAWTVDAIPVERGTPDRAAIRACIAALDAGEALYVAPEGTRSNDGRLQRGLAGVTLILLRAGTHIPIYPLGYHGVEDFWPYAKRLRRTPIQVVVGEPFYLDPPPGRVRQQVREEITAEMMGQIAALLPEKNRGVYAGQVGRTPRYLRFES